MSPALWPSLYFQLRCERAPDLLAVYALAWARAQPCVTQPTTITCPF